MINPNGTVSEWTRVPYPYSAKVLRNEHVPALSSIVAVAAGSEGHKLALRADGTVWAWGKNAGGQLGLGDFTDRELPTQIPNLTNIKAISAGHSHSVALTENGYVYAWGYNTWGEIGNGYASYVMWDGSDAYDGTPSPQLMSAQNIKSIAAGGSVTILITNDGTTYACGDNSSRQLGLDYNYIIWSGTLTQIPNLTDIKKVSIGSHFCLALDEAGDVWSWGWNGQGSLGDGTPEWVEDSTGWWGDIFRATPQRNPLLSDINNIAAGFSNGMAQANNGSLYIWGMGKGLPSIPAPYIPDPVQAVDRPIGYNTPVLVLNAESPLAIAAGADEALAVFESAGPVGDIREVSLGSVELDYKPVMLEDSLPIPLGRYESDKTFTIFGTMFHRISRYIGFALTDQGTSAWGWYHTPTPTVLPGHPSTASVSTGTQPTVNTSHPGFDGFLVNLSTDGTLIKWPPPPNQHKPGNPPSSHHRSQQCSLHKQLRKSAFHISKAGRNGLDDR